MHSNIEPQEYINDSGPLYHEFQADALIHEPWNAFSSLFFLIPVIFWVWKLRGQYLRYPMITIFLPLLFLNGIGSTVYHAFRASDVALLLDWLPAFIMNLMLCWYMWNKVLRKPFLSGLIVLGFITSTFFMMAMHGPGMGDLAANLAYLMIGLCLLTPSFIYLFKTRFYKWQYLLLTFVALGVALVFRSLDYPTPNPFPDILPQGTHFLWHIVSALAVFTLGFYFKFTRDKELELKSTD